MQIMKNHSIVTSVIFLIALLGQDLTFGQSQVTFDNGVDETNNNIFFFADDNAGQNLADDVTLNATTKVSKVAWFGIYNGGTPSPVDNFVIRIYADNNGPTGLPIDIFQVGNNVNRELTGPTLVYSYCADINFTFLAGVTYWISIQDQDVSNTRFFAWSAIDGVGNNRFSGNGGNSWSADDADLAFTLFAEPVFDNGVELASANISPDSDLSVPFVVADNVIISTTNRVRRIEWSGGYRNNVPATDDFEIRIYADENGFPSGSPLATFEVGNDVNRIEAGNSGQFTYSADIDFVFVGDTTYWISIFDRDTTANQIFGWNGLLGGNHRISFDSGETWLGAAFPSELDMTLFGCTVELPNIDGTFSPNGFDFEDSSTDHIFPNQALFYEIIYDGTAELSLDTRLSPEDVDTEIALFDSDGFLLAENDNFKGLQSELLFDSLPAGTYYLAVAGNDTVFGDGFSTEQVSVNFIGNTVRTTVITGPPLLLGDVNCDGVVNLLDIEPFVDLVSNGEFDAKADINEDGVVSLLDIEPFITILTGG